MSSSQQVTGIASGFDTASIVDQLMKIEKIPYEKLDIKKQTQQLRLQAYQAVNSMMLKFQTSVSSLASQKLWKAKSATSTNEKSLTANANEYAVNGSYSFKVAQLAAATQFMTKGFASSKTALAKQANGEAAYKIGEISMNSAKSRVDNSAKLEVLNGGKGVYRGSVRITDAKGGASTIDLSGCDTVDDVIRALNDSAGAQISAAIVDGRLTISDVSQGAGELRIQNFGAGTTATDLGIAGTSTGGVLQGKNVYVMGNETALSMLNDGLGVEEGRITLRVSNSSSYIDVLVDVNECATVGDVIKRVNQEIEYRYQNNSQDPNGGGFGGELLKDLRFGLNAENNGFALTGTQAGFSYSFTNYYSTNDNHNMAPADQLGLTGKVQTATGDRVEFGRILGDMNSPMLKNLAGVNGYGIGEAGGASKIPVAMDGGTKVSHLNSGTGVDISRPLSIQITEGGDSVSGGKGLSRVFDDIVNMNVLQTLVADENLTLDNLLGFLNGQIADYVTANPSSAAALKGLNFAYETNSGMTGIFIKGAQGGYKYEIGGSLMASLGLTRMDASGNSIVIDDANYVAGSPAGEPGYDARKTAIEDFYDVGAGSAANSYFDDNSSLSGDTTLRELAYLHGQSTDADIDAWIDGLLGASGSLTLAIGGVSHDIDLSSLDFGPDTKISDFMSGVNAAIAGALPSGTTAPQLRIHTFSDRLQWSNMDFSQDFSATGSLAAAFKINKSISAAAVPNQYSDYAPTNFNPMAPGYYTELEISAANADNVLLRNLNYGAGLTLSGVLSDSLDIDLGGGHAISVKLNELANELNGYGGFDAKLSDYVTALNKVVQDELDALNTTNGFTGSDEIKLSFRVGNGGIEAHGFQNVSSLNISGPLADPAKTGIGPVDIATVEANKTYSTGELKAFELVEDEVEGLGKIALQLGTDAPIELDTAGLDGDSTLNELIEHLNRQLQGIGGDYGNIRFAVNSAGTGIAVDNRTAQEIKFIDSPGQRISRDLGLVSEDGKDGVRVAANSIHNSTSLGRNYISRATKLSDYMGTSALGAIEITNAAGASYVLDLDQSELKTIGDLMDAINFNTSFGVQVAINERGDGIRAVEAYGAGETPSIKPTGNISISDVDGGGIAKKLGIAGTGVRNLDGWGDNSVLEGSMRTVVDVMSSDTLESLMYRISEKGGYKTAIVNDGSSTNPYRLTISSATTGEASDFVIESDLDIFGFNQTSRGKDSKVLYGDPNSSASPIMLSSSTNSNANAILGLTLELKSVTGDYTTITVDTDKEKVVEELKNMVQAYNDMNDLISALDAYDAETGEPGVLFGDTNVRKLMEDINDMFYMVFNPNQKAIGSTNDKGELNTWTWMDIGVSLTAKNSNSDGSGSWFSSMDLDLDKLDEMVAQNWDVLYRMLAEQRNASDSTLESTVRATAAFNGKGADGFKADNAINGDANTASWGVNNGFMADGTIADGENEYTIYFQKATTLSRMSIYHYDSDTALKNFTIEYLDAGTGKWETIREVENNSVDANHLGLPALPTATAVRIKATSTNAEDGKFRLLDVQVFEDTGLAGTLNQLTTKLGNTTSGWLYERDQEVKESLTDIQEQMDRLQERLDSKEASLWKRFTAMESALGQLQNQSNYFSSMMDSISTKKK